VVALCVEPPRAECPMVWIFLLKISRTKTPPSLSSCLADTGGGRCWQEVRRKTTVRFVGSVTSSVSGLELLSQMSDALLLVQPRRLRTYRCTLSETLLTRLVVVRHEYPDADELPNLGPTACTAAVCRVPRRPILVWGPGHLPRGDSPPPGLKRPFVCLVPNPGRNQKTEQYN
jgi:hypothetical protein